jgi:FdhD protein
MVVERIRDFEIRVVSQGQGVRSKNDRIAGEEPLEIRIEGTPLAVVMRTPGDDVELAAGFLHAESIIESSDDVDTIAHCRDETDPDLTNVVNVRLSEARRKSTEAKLAAKSAERATITSASCGVCGKKTIESLHASAKPFERAPAIDVDLIRDLPRKLRSAQQVFDETGGLHAAAVFDRKGDLLVLREDIGRHNAVDKCVGHLLLSEKLPVDGAMLMVSGRTSFEIVQKALLARIPIVAAVSAPSSLAIELARESNMGLCGFVRDGNLNLYSGVIDDRAST